MNTIIPGVGKCPICSHYPTIGTNWVYQYQYPTNTSDVKSQEKKPDIYQAL